MRPSLAPISLAALRSLKPNCVNHGLCVGDIKPPFTLPASPAALTHTERTRRPLKGTFAGAPFIYKADDGRSLIRYPRTVFTPLKSAQQVFRTAWSLAPSSLRLKPRQATAPRVLTVNGKCSGHNQTKNRRCRRLGNYFCSPDVSALALFGVRFIRFS